MAPRNKQRARIDLLEGRLLLSGTLTYNRTAAVAYANQYAYEVVSDGYFWLNGDVSSITYYGAGSPVPVGASGEASGIGDDCAHFVSSCIGQPPGGGAGGLNIPTRVSPSYGEPSAYRLDELLISKGWAEQVSSVDQLQPGDVIGYDWDGGTSMNGIDHTVIYLGNGLIAAHATSHDGVNWDMGGTAFFIHITVPTTAAVTTPTNVSPANNSTVTTLTPTLSASAFSDTKTGAVQSAAQWQIFQNGSPIYDSGVQAPGVTSVTVPAGILGVGATYTWDVRYEDNSGNFSSYSTATTFSTPQPSVLTLSGSELYLRADASANNLDVWNSTTPVGQPAQQISLALVTKVLINGSSAGSNITLDFSNGDLAPAGRITVLGAGNQENNVLSIVGTSTGNDTITGETSQLMMNGVYIPSSNFDTVEYTPTAGLNSLSLSSGTLVLGDTGAAAVQFSSLNLTGSATLDIGEDTLVVPYSAGSDPVASIAAMIASSYENGSWSGVGITSSLVMADSDHSTAVGYFDDGSQVKIRATWIGDANCSGNIDADDMALMVVGQKQGTTGWSSGNFNYDQKVNADDWMSFALAAGYSAGRDYSQVFAAAAIALAPMQSNDLLGSPAKVLS